MHKLFTVFHPIIQPIPAWFFVVWIVAASAFYLHPDRLKPIHKCRPAAAGQTVNYVQRVTGVVFCHQPTRFVFISGVTSLYKYDFIPRG